MELSKRLLSNDFLKKLMLLVSVGTPGIFRIAILFTLTQLYTMDMVGVVVYKWAIISTISLLTVDGLGALISSRLPKAENKVMGVTVIAKQFSNGLTLLCLLLLVWLIADPEFSYHDAIFAVSWLVYGMCRRILITTGEYLYLLMLEGVSMLVALSLLFVFKNEITNSNVSLIFTPLGFFSICLLALLYGRTLFPSIKPSFELIGIKFGFANLLSGGVGLALIPVIRTVYGDEWVGYLGLVLSILNVIFLAPRTMAQFHIPRMSQLTGLAMFDMYKTYRLQLYVCLLFSLLAAPIIWYVEKNIYFHAGDDLAYFYIYMAVYVSMVVGQFSLAPANYFMVSEQPKSLLMSNYIHVIILSIVSVLILVDMLPNSSTGVLALYLAALGSNFLRLIYMSYAVAVNESGKAKEYNTACN
ncbi:MAG: hypothetical protein RPS47_00290 [Colwellia sp.]